MLSKYLTGEVVDCTIGHIVVTDHATVQLVMKIGKDMIKKSRLNISIFQDQTFTNPLREDLKYFFETNIGSTEKLDGRPQRTV